MTISLPSTMAPLGGAVSSTTGLATPSILFGPNIDPSTNDFVSLIDGIDAIDSQVVLAMKLRRNTGPSITNQGHELDKIRKIKESTPNDIKAQIRRTLDRLIKNRDIRFIGTIIDINDPGNQTIQGRTEWVNLRAFDNLPRRVNLAYNP